MVSYAFHDDFCCSSLLEYHLRRDVYRNVLNIIGESFVDDFFLREYLEMRFFEFDLLVLVVHEVPLFVVHEEAVAIDVVLAWVR